MTMMLLNHHVAKSAGNIQTSHQTHEHPKMSYNVTFLSEDKLESVEPISLSAEDLLVMHLTNEDYDRISTENSVAITFLRSNCEESDDICKRGLEDKIFPRARRRKSITRSRSKS